MVCQNWSLIISRYVGISRNAPIFSDVSCKATVIESQLWMAATLFVSGWYGIEQTSMSSNRFRNWGSPVKGNCLCICLAEAKHRFKRVVSESDIVEARRNLNLDCSELWQLIPNSLYGQVSHALFSLCQRNIVDLGDRKIADVLCTKMNKMPQRSCLSRTNAE